MNGAPVVEALFFWAALGGRDEAPTRIQLMPCGRCFGMVPAEHLQGHLDWHRKLGD